LEHLGESMHNQTSKRRREITFVALILIPEVFLNTFFIAFISARSPARVEVACAFM